MLFTRSTKWLRFAAVAVAAVATTCGASAANADPGGWWHPAKGLTWQWNLHDKVTDLSIDAQVYDIDLFENPADTVQTLHQRGRKAICYMSAGSWEPKRPDSDKFPDSVKGPNLKDWPDEKWLDIRQISVLQPIMAARMDQCKAKGFDGVEPDLQDVFAQPDALFGGKQLSSDDQLAYNKMLVGLAHERGLAIGLKNDLEQITDLVDSYDFEVNEECAEQGECDALKPFIAQNKPVFHAEYKLGLDEFCPISKSLGLSSIHKHRGLDAWRETCP
ncbi:endo alpha-1,4 polygalactosaminidase [Nocardia arthritidis]|uniref:Endo alpha-1,4 polygalactosaminidase n=1 Tax=Nocardia arthritidis TaxID=228602 RepID=A0A6G9YBC9_9NOCA|nr:endo alpha-1,4 polygalactosaminidase [Nocardia arthritidis]QIS10512.1 endo alpha-1,4 polygalactosaminidase [Nocardia arthritidis]